MNLAESSFLARYYFANAIQSKFGGRIFAKRTIAKGANHWREILSTHSGHDSWLVVGNGPSLSVKDLAALDHIPAIASNKITLLYGHTDWRPTLYTIADPLLLYKLTTSHFKSVPLTLVPHTVYFMARASRKLAWRSMTLDEGEAWFKRTGGMPDPIESGFIGTYTVTTANIQIAIWCGAKTVYLIGCDHNYQEDQYDKVKKMTHLESANHFHPDYRKSGEIVNNAPITLMERGFSLLHRIAQSHGVRIINITRRTALHTFERGTVENAATKTIRILSNNAH